MKIGFYVLLALAVTGQCFGGVRVIVHPSVGETSVTRQEINDIFMGKKLFWKDRTKIHVAHLEAGKVTEAFLKEYLKITPGQYRMHQQKMVFTGPKASQLYLKSSRKMVEFVSMTPGAIGYVDSNDLPSGVESLSVVD